MHLTGRSLPSGVEGIVIALTIAFAFVGYTSADESIPRDAVVSDLETLQELLIESHIAPFAYASEKEVRSAFAVAKASMEDEGLSMLDAYRALQRGTSALKNGHTSVDFPVAPYLSYADAGGSVFPLELAFENGKALVRANFSGNRRIQHGDEITKINGVPIDEVLDQIYPLVSAERPYYAKAKIELLTLPRYYWYTFGEVASFTVSLKHQSGMYSDIVLSAIPALEAFEEVRLDILSEERRLEWLDKVAYLKPGFFSGDKDQFDQFLKDVFSEIRERDPHVLILDLRNNPGGDDAFSDQLVSYIARKPFQWCHHFMVKTSDALKHHARTAMDPESDYTKALLSHPSGSLFGYDFEAVNPQPREKRFHGQVYALVNRQTHSQAAVAAAQLQDYNWATIVGEETAEYPSLYASLFPYTLPQTGISVQISKGQIVRVSGDESQNGVLPDVVIPDRLLDSNDEILQGLLSQLTQLTQIRRLSP